MTNRDEWAPMVWPDFQGECFLKGHDCDFDDAFRCRRCHEHLSYEEIGYPGAWAWVVHAWHYYFYVNYSEWLSCSGCGEKYGRHSSTCDGPLPF